MATPASDDLPSAPAPLSAARRWGAGLVVAAVAVALRAVLQPLLGEQLPFVVAFPALALAAAAWGVESGLIVAAACAAAVAIPGVHPDVPAAERPLQIGVFAVAAILICLGCGWRRDRRLPPTAGDARFDTPLTAWLRAVVWGCVLIPTTAFVAAAWWGYERAVEDAHAAAQRAARLVAGQAERTLSIAGNIARRADEAALGDDADVRAREKDVHERLADMVAGLPSVVNLNVWDAAGRPLARSDRFPVDPAASVADRGYFLEQKLGARRLGLSEVIIGRQTGLELMNATIRRTSVDGAFTGVVAVSLSPAFFRDYFRSLASENPRLAGFALVRTDGTVLAEWPHVAGEHRRAGPRDEVQQRIDRGEASGDLALDDERAGARFASFQRVGDFPAYVVTGYSRAAMLASVLRYLGVLAALLAPVTAGLVYVALVALRKTRREQAMGAALGEAMARRAAAEKSAIEGQKLETLAQLTGGVAHDFNNLLAIVDSSLHVHALLHPELAGERQVQAMARAVQSGTRLTRQLLSFSRRQALRPEELHLQEWLPGIEGLIRSTLGARVELEIRVEPGTRPVVVDAAELELALINLALNARHAMPGGGRLAIGAHNGLVDGLERVVISVADTGLGIPPEVLPRVFEPFFTTRTEGAGSGLGLSQVHGLCVQSGGGVRLESTPGAGTRVEMILPARPARQPAAAPAEAPAAEPLAGRLLLVEDNEDVASSTAAILVAAGLEVSHLASADAALAALRSGEQQPDAVLSDIEMPGRLSGLDLALRLRDERPGLPVVLITGYAKRVDEAVAGGLRVLPKPTRAADLVRELRAAMAAASEAAQPPR